MLRHYMKASRICAYFMMVASLLCLLTGLVFQDRFTIIVSLIYVGFCILIQTVVLKIDVETVGHRFEEEIPFHILKKARRYGLLSALVWAFILFGSYMNVETYEILSNMTKRSIQGSEIGRLMINLPLLLLCVAYYFYGARRYIIDRYIRETAMIE